MLGKCFWHWEAGILDYCNVQDSPADEELSYYSLSHVAKKKAYLFARWKGVLGVDEKRKGLRNANW